MTDLEQILALWRELSAAGTDYVLATVVSVEGSGYRKPGARMLISADGRRAGTISGGCLEGDVARKAFWHTQGGQVVRRYSTRAEDGEVPYGMGCGGVVVLLLERAATASRLLERLAESFESRQALAVATVLQGRWVGRRVFFPEASETKDTDSADLGPAANFAELARLAEFAMNEKQSFAQHLSLDKGEFLPVRVDWHAARPGLHIFGAGDDAVPLVKLARQLGWFVSVADGRSHLATRNRFPEAHETHVLADGAHFPSGLRPTDAAVLMTHSMDQDQRLLGMLLDTNLAYLGLLGPARRTHEMLLNLAENMGLPETSAENHAHEWLKRIHAPMGLDLGASTPATIALEILAEIQLVLHSASGRPLREIRREVRRPIQESPFLSAGTRS